jgi:hypothetical protein
MKEIYLILNASGEIMGWTLTKEFAERVLAEGETIMEMTNAA